MDPVNPFKTKAFKKLFKKWNNKLEKAGHDEIENFNLEDPAFLNKSDASKFKNVTPEEYESRSLYYSNARSLLHTFAFESSIQKRIWELHADGMSLRQIEELIKYKLKKDRINFHIHKVRTWAMPR